MRIDSSIMMKRIDTAWSNICRARLNGGDTDSFLLFGPRGSGKTKMAQEFVRSHANAFYISFENLSPEESLCSFCRTYLPESAAIQNFSQAVNALISSMNENRYLFFMEEETNTAIQECTEALQSAAKKRPGIVLCFLTSLTEHHRYYDVKVPYLTISDFYRLFPKYSRQNIVRLFALTGGIPEIVKELDAEADFDENIRRLLSYDSAFSALLPSWLSRCFRSPDSYYPILCSIAEGKHRLSEIAKAVGFPNNKCGTYLDALIRHGFVVADQPPQAKQATYYLSNSYFTAWCRYVCGKQMMQIANPELLFDFVKTDMDSSVAVPAFRDACMRYVKVNYRMAYSEAKEIRKDVLIDGTAVPLDYCFFGNFDPLFCILPHTLDARCTKDVLEDIYKAVEHFVPLFDAQIVIFSLERFSDWCVHEAAIQDGLFEVTIERLKY